MSKDKETFEEWFEDHQDEHGLSSRENTATRAYEFGKSQALSQLQELREKNEGLEDFVKIFNHEYDGKPWSVGNFMTAWNNWNKKEQALSDNQEEEEVSFNREPHETDELSLEVHKDKLRDLDS